MDITTITGLLRTLLAFGGGILVSRGIIDEGTMTAAVGAIVTLATTIWSVTHHVTANDPSKKTIP